MQEHQFNRRIASTLLAAVTALAIVMPLASQAGNDKKAKPLLLKEQGSFYVAGSIVETPAISGAGATPTPGLISIDHSYVQYQIPVDQKYRYPIIMVHGGGHTGKTYETTPDGREGWYTSFARRGFSPYVIDDPNRGRACCEPTRIHLVRLGLAPPSTLPSTNIYSKQLAWSVFRFGPQYPDTYQNARFPFGAIDQYAPQWVLTYRDAIELDKITAAITALVDKLGPCILMAHSQSGPLALRAALARPGLVKGYVAIEPAGFGIPTGQTASTLKNVPILTVFGDYTALSAQSSGWVASALDTGAQVNAAGGDASQIVLPNIGIVGNTHMMMMDNNSEQIADIVEKWIRGHVRHVIGSSRPR
jgi:pimeloyl-ACP methyl ester carboxylesterase